MPSYRAAFGFCVLPPPLITLVSNISNIILDFHYILYYIIYKDSYFQPCKYL